MDNENPYRHINEFLNVCETLTVTNVDDDLLKFRLFPFSLKEKVKHWSKSVSLSVSITYWEEIKREFLKITS